MKVLTKPIRCENCGKPTQHPLSILRQICAHLPESTMEIERINYCCPWCNHLRHAWIPAESVQVDFGNQSQAPSDTIPFLIAIECAGKNCLARVSVFAPMKLANVSTSPIQARDQVRNWRVDAKVRCPEGHPPMIPCEVGGIRIVESKHESC